MVSSVDNSNNVQSYTHERTDETSLPKTGSRDSDGDNGGNKPGEIEHNEQVRNDTNGNYIDQIV